MTLRLKAFLTACGAAALLASAPGPALAQNPIGELLQGFGILPSEQKEIDYRERAPLVVPPKTVLRQPEATIEERAAGNWPVDPDVERRKREASNRMLPVPFQFGNPRPEMSAAELRAGRRASTAYTAPANSANENDRYNLLYAPIKQMDDADKRRAEAAKDLTPGSEPPRRSLAEPPPGYRRATQIVKAKREAFVPMGDETGQKSFARDEKRSYQ